MKSFHKFLALFIMLILAANLTAQDYQKRNRTETFNLPRLPDVNSFFNYTPDNPMNTIKQDFTIALRDGVILDATKFFPSDANPYLPNGYPVVIMVHGYGDRKETLENFATSQSSYGYVVYTYSVRGQGNSGGLSNLISRTEALDLIELVNYVKHDNVNTGSDSSNVLIMGGSQGGTLPYMASAMGMKVKGVISALTSPEFASSWIDNGCVKMTLLWTCDYTSDTARYSPLVSRFPSWIYSNAKDKWDSLAYWVPKDRDFKNIISNNTNPVLIENSWQDMFFNASGSINSIPFVNFPSRFYFGAVMGHGGDTSPVEDEWHMNFFNEWFFYWLFGIQNNILTRPKYHYAYTSFPERSPNMWSFVHDSSEVWPPQGITNTKLYFNPGKLKKNPYAFSFLFGILSNFVFNNYTLSQIVADEFKGTRFNNNFRKDSVIYMSDPMPSGMKMVGTPTLKLDYFSTASVCQFNFQIYEVASTGQSKFITSINYTDRNYSILSRKQKLIHGNSHAHIFQPGSKIKIVVTNLDTRANYPFLGTNPFVLPVMNLGIHGIFYSQNSYLELPVLGASPFTSPLSVEEEPLVPEKFALSQNYPNPFNPVTKINYFVPKDFRGNVTLKVYDMTGKEVASLVNGPMEAGSHEVTWNASKYSSGIYFYRLTAGVFSEVRKMSFVK